MTRLSRTLSAGLLFLAGITLAYAADYDRGQLLYENHCTGCHESQAHVRESRKADTRAALRTQIDRWRLVLDLSWSDGEIDDVLQYLNQRYYRFPEDR